MPIDLMQQAVAGELLDVIERAKEERLRLLRQLREVEGRIAAVNHAVRPPGEHADVLLRRIDEADSRLAQRLGELQKAEAGLRKHTEAAVRIEATLSKLSGAFAEQLEVVRPAVKEVGQIKQQLRDAAHAAIEQTRTSLEALRSPVMEELARLDEAEHTMAQRVEAMRLRTQDAIAGSLQRTEQRMHALFGQAREQGAATIEQFAQALREAADQRVDERIDRVNEQLDHHLRAVNHRMLAQQKQIDDLLDQRQERALAMLADAEGVLEQCAQHFDEAQQQINQRLLQQREQLDELLEHRHRDAIETIKAAQPNTSHVVTDLAADFRRQLQAHVDTAIADANGLLQHHASDLRESFAAMVRIIKSQAARELATEPLELPQSTPMSATVEIASTDQLTAPMQEIASRVGVLSRDIVQEDIDSSLHLG